MPAAFDRLIAAIVDRPDDVLAGTVAVVEDGLAPTVAVGVQQLPGMGEAVPPRGVPQRHFHDVVAESTQRGSSRLSG